MKFPKIISNSFIKKLFFSLALLFLIVFIIIFFLQSIVFKEFYTQRTIDNNISEITAFFEDVSLTSINESTINYMQDTNTTALFAPYGDFQGSFDTMNLIKITITQNAQDFLVYVPYIDSLSYEEDQIVSATIVEIASTDEYIPLKLKIGGDLLINSRWGTVENIYSNFIPNINKSLKQEIVGTITNISFSTENTNNLHPIISNEILNIASNNYYDSQEFSSDGLYYYTSSLNNDNLVFLATSEIDGEDYILVAVYPLSHIDDIVEAVKLINIYLFGMIFVILLFASFIYSKQFSKPLVSINNSTKEISNLNFESTLIEIKGNDEFAELAKNINTLSVNLKTALTELKEKNLHLSNSFDRENKNELLRKDFVSGMSHELKTPLAIIQASAESLEKYIFTDEGDRTKQLILIQKEVSKTNLMIQNMLKISNLDSSNFKANFSEFSLDDLLIDVIENIEPLIKNKNINFTMDISKIVFLGDKEKIDLVFNNLIGNAIKYSPEGESIHLSLKNNIDNIIFSITNTGTTISNDEKEKLFEPFYRVDKSRNRIDGSSGLGLYIVNQILSQYDSKCTVSSELNSVTFSFEIKITNSQS